MKTFAPAHVTHADGHGIALALEGGGTFSVQVLEASLVRVRYAPAAGYKEPRTWAIAPQPGHDVPWRGRARDDVSGFSCPAATLTRHDKQVTLTTGALSLTLRPHPLALSWADGQGRPLVHDRGTSA